jgi:hypothetical protein
MIVLYLQVFGLALVLSFAQRYIRARPMDLAGSELVVT